MDSTPAVFCCMILQTINGTMAFCVKSRTKSEKACRGTAESDEGALRRKHRCLVKMMLDFLGIPQKKLPLLHELPESEVSEMKKPQIILGIDTFSFYFPLSYHQKEQVITR